MEFPNNFSGKEEILQPEVASLSTPSPSSSASDTFAPEETSSLVENESIFDLLDKGSKNFEDHGDFFARKQTETSNIEAQLEDMVLSEWNGIELSKVIEDLYHGSANHAEILQTKQLLEQESQNSHNGLWMFKVEQKVIQTECGEGNLARYPYTVKTAVFNDQLNATLDQKFHELHQFNVGPVFSTLLQQTLSELKLQEFVYSLLPQLKKDASFAISKPTLEKLFEVIERKDSLMSAKSLYVYRQAILFVGTIMLSQRPDSNALLSVGEQSQESLSLYFLSHLIRCSGAQWGSPLLQPTIEEVLQQRFLYKILAENQEMLRSQAQISQMTPQQLVLNSRIKQQIFFQ
eukprot:TRINITY_DN2762_c0_g1_i3.p1 TRINITY_DN2762_c0_g1~~TRINITY_DN2762_c0_g1_i3.p1  ORF type:complete len:347 (+),score=78.13 TRINITY_DN2762_c0_g1_i3:138-1178(+)